MITETDVVTAYDEPPAFSTTAETSATTDQTTLPPANGGTSYCSVHSELYHSFPRPWINYVGESAFYQWIEDTRTDTQSDSNGCPFPNQNIFTFIRDFDYPKDVFIEQYNTHIWVDYGHNIDVLYGEDAEKADKYYRETYKESETILKQIEELNELKHKLCNEYPEKLEAYGNWKTIVWLK